jgi:hypothetical protein
MASQEKGVKHMKRWRYLKGGKGRRATSRRCATPATGHGRPGTASANCNFVCVLFHDAML